jgi:four helix bundle protein
MKNFHDLLVWRKAHSVVLACYKYTRNFPKEELYGITSQVRRCSVSIPANIAEGCGKRSNAEFQRFLVIAAGSASELEYHILLARDLDMLAGSEYENLNCSVLEVKRMLAALIIKVERDRKAG